MKLIRIMRKTPIVEAYIQSVEDAIDIGDYKEGTIVVKTEGTPGPAIGPPSGSGEVGVLLFTANVNDEGRYSQLGLQESGTFTVLSHSGLGIATIEQSGDPVGRYLRVALIPILPASGYVNVEVTFQPKRS